MYTQCPQCLTYFQVTPEHLRIAQGNVRCGQCRNVFSALGNLTEEPPQVPLEDNDSELEEEIFIDEGELEDYAEEYSEEFYVIEEEFEEDIEEAIGDQEPQQPAPPEAIDVEKTNIIPPQQPSQTTAQPAISIQTPNRSTPNSSKLSEAIATIEKLKQSYTNLSFRQLEKRGPVPNVASANQGTANQPTYPEQPQPEETSAQLAVTATEKPKQKKSPAHIAKPAKDQIEPPPKPTTDIAIEHYPEDDGVDYEEALNALNELKIIEEESEETVSDDSEDSPKQPNALEQEPNLAEEAVEFENNLSIDEEDIVSNEQALFADQDLREKILSEEVLDEENLANEQIANHTDNEDRHVKVKSLDRKAREQAASAKESEASEPDSEHIQPKYLPAIPKQLLEDFHPQPAHDSQHHAAVTLWSIGSILMMLVFLVQTVYFKHNDLAQVQQLRPWIETFCGFMSCELSLPSDVGQLELVSQDIRSHPKVKSALLVTTTIINNAQFTQPYPGLQITFSDLNGQRVAMRRFAPSEYLSKGVVQETGMPPNTPIQVELEMMDPGSNAVNFEFDFIPLS